MLLQSVVAELDRELGRLHALRSIVAGLSRTPKAVARLISSPKALAGQNVTEPALPEREQHKPQRKTRVDAGTPRDKRPRKAKVLPQSSALAATVPSGPVVFNPARLAEEKARREQAREEARSAEPAQASMDLDALARSMASQWGTSLVQ